MGGVSLVNGSSSNKLFANLGCTTCLVKGRFLKDVVSPYSMKEPSPFSSSAYLNQ